MRTELEAEGAPVSVTLIHPGRVDTPYNEHARSYMPKQPAHRGMIYPPEAVAEAILFSAEHPKRDMFVGMQAKALAVVAGISPRLADKLIELWAFPWQQSDRARSAIAKITRSMGCTSGVLTNAGSDRVASR